MSQLSRKIRKRHIKIVLPKKKKLYAIEVFISKALINSHINQDESVSVNFVLRKYNEMKGEIKNAENAVEYSI